MSNIGVGEKRPKEKMRQESVPQTGYPERLAK